MGRGLVLFLLFLRGLGLVLIGAVEASEGDADPLYMYVFLSFSIRFRYFFSSKSSF